MANVIMGHVYLQSHDHRTRHLQSKENHRHRRGYVDNALPQVLALSLRATTSTAFSIRISMVDPRRRPIRRRHQPVGGNEAPRPGARDVVTSRYRHRVSRPSRNALSLRRAPVASRQGSVPQGGSRMRAPTGRATVSSLARWPITWWFSRASPRSARRAPAARARRRTPSAGKTACSYRRR